MKRYLLVLMILSGAWSARRCNAQVVDTNKIVQSLTRCWRTISHEFSPIYGLEDEEIKAYTKQRICFTKDSIVMYQGVLYSPKFSIRKVNSEEFAKSNFECSKDKLDIVTDSVFEITILSDSRPNDAGDVHKMTDIIAFDEDFIFVVADGVIFRLYDADKKIQGRGSN